MNKLWTHESCSSETNALLRKSGPKSVCVCVWNSAQKLHSTVPAVSCVSLCWYRRAPSCQMVGSRNLTCHGPKSGVVCWCVVHDTTDRDSHAWIWLCDENRDLERGW